MKQVYKYSILSLVFILTATLTCPLSLLAQGSDVRAEVSLSNRDIVGSIPGAKVQTTYEGIVVVNIWVDQYGTVTKAVAGGEGTTVTDSELWTKVRNSAMGTHFNMSAEAPALQEGYIKYIVTPKEYDDKDFFLKEGSGSYAIQDRSPFEFMGIPIRGTMSQMKMRLVDKGFEDFRDNMVEGIFNGEDSRIEIRTNSGVVDRIIVRYSDSYLNEEVRIKYNNLLSRFLRNDKYVSVANFSPIMADDRFFNRKNHYDSYFFQLYEGVDANQWVGDFKRTYGTLYSEPLNTLSYEELEEVVMCLPQAISDAIRGVVWFTIDEFDHIEIYYDNFSSRPRGEDL